MRGRFGNGSLTLHLVFLHTKSCLKPKDDSVRDLNPTVGVVTVTYNSGVVLSDFMNSLLRQSHSDFKLYVIDSSSSDGTVPMLRAYSDPRIAIVQQSENVGAAEGNNIGIRAALQDGCALILMINNDTSFEADLIAKLVAGLSERKCDMIVPKMLYFDEPGRIWCAGGYFSALRGASGHYGFRQKDDGRFDKPRDVPYSPTTCMLIRSEVFECVGMLDNNYFSYFEDTDFCLRAHRAGMRLLYLPNATLQHKVGSLTSVVTNFNVRFHTRNHVYFVLKNYARWRALLYCFAYYLYLPAKYLVILRRPAAFEVAEKAFREGFSLFSNYRETAARTPEPNVAA
jgi:GT2 family glycosyltransferase